MGFSRVFQIHNFLGLFLGTIIGYFVGAMPGLTQCRKLNL